MYIKRVWDINMGENKKPILSVLVDEEKKTRFANLAREHNYSMGWLLNQAIDKMLEAGTIHIYRDSIPPIDKAAPRADLINLDELKAEVGYLRECMAGMASIDYVEKALEPVHLAISKVSISTSPAKQPQQSAINAAPAPVRNRKKKSDF
jgi:hypothetical protein